MGNRGHQGTQRNTGGHKGHKRKQADIGNIGGHRGHKGHRGRQGTQGGHRRGSRINTDRFPTSTEVWGHAPPGICFGFLLPKVPFSGFLSHSDRKFTDYTNYFPDFNLESVKFFYLKYSYN